MSERTLILVADGHAARIFIETRRGGPLVEKTGELDIPDPHRAKSSQPGRVFDRFGHASHGVGGEDPHDSAEREFLQDLASRIGAYAAQCDAEAIVVIAAPRALGVLREALDDNVRKLVILTEPADRLKATRKDLTLALRRLRRAA